MLDVIACILILLCVPVFGWMIANILRWYKEDRAWRACFSDTPMTNEELHRQYVDALSDQRALQELVDRKTNGEK